MAVPYSAGTSHANEWRFWQDRENATLLARTAPGVYDSHPLKAAGGAAKRRALTYRELMASNGAYSHNNLVWLLPAANLPAGVEPRAGHRVRDADDYEYTVLEVQKGKFGETHRCITVCLELVEELRELATIERPAGLKDGGGRLALTTYAELHADVPCRLQPLESARGEEFGRTTSPHRFVAYLDLDVEALRARDVLVVAGQRYTIDRLGEVARLDRLPEIECTLID